MSCPRTIGRRSAPGECLLGLEQYATAQDDSTFTTTSGVFVSTGKRLITPVLPAGDYRFGVYYLARCEWFGLGEWNIDLDGGGFLFPTTHSEEFDSADDERCPYYRSRIVTLSNAAHTFTLQARSSGGFSSSTFETMFELWADQPSLAGQGVCPCACAQYLTVSSHVVSGRTLAGRPFVTPPLAAGVYRLEVSWAFRRTAGSAADFNIDLLGVDVCPNDVRERPANTDDWCPREIVREITLGAGSHTFDLVLDTSSSTTIQLGQCDWYLHRTA